jgi:hypothetical protein
MVATHQARSPCHVGGKRVLIFFLEIAEGGVGVAGFF